MPRHSNDWETERQAYHVLYPQVGAESASIAGLVMPVWWAMPILGVGGAAAGHVTGRMVAAHRATEIDAAASDKDKLPAGPDVMSDDPDPLSADMDAGPPGGVMIASPADAP